MYDVSKIRQMFPMLNGKSMQGKPLVYLDNCSTTFKPQCVIDAINSYYMEKTANSHRGDYDLLYNMDQEVLATRNAVARFISCEPNEVIFTSGDTQSLNTVAYGYGLYNLKENDEIILSYEEHASNLLPWYQVAKLTKARIVFAPIDEKGFITVSAIESVINDKTKIISLAQVGNVLGYEIDVKGITELAHKRNIIVVIDGAQSVPHMKVDFKELDIDFLTFSSHKMCGPTGIGCLIGKIDLLEKMNNFMLGGGMNVDFDIEGNYINLPSPTKFEAGTMHLAGIMGLKKAIEFIESIGIENIEKHDEELLSYARDRLKDFQDIIIYNPFCKHGILTFNIKGVFSQDEATLLNYKGIAIRSGQHCAKIIDEFLKVNSTCRMSTYLYTTKEEIDAFVDALLEKGDILDAYFAE